MLLMELPLRLMTYPVKVVSLFFLFDGDQLYSGFLDCGLDIRSRADTREIIRLGFCSDDSPNGVNVLRVDDKIDRSGERVFKIHQGELELFIQGLPGNPKR